MDFPTSEIKSVEPGIRSPVANLPVLWNPYQRWLPVICDFISIQQELEEIEAMSDSSINGLWKRANQLLRRKAELEKQIIKKQQKIKELLIFIDPNQIKN